MVKNHGMYSYPLIVIFFDQTIVEIVIYIYIVKLVLYI